MTRTTVSSLLAAVVISLALPFLAGAQDSRVKTVTVNGHPMRVKMSGMDKRANAPTIVFEAALGDGLDTWNPLFEQVSVLAPVVTYDRAGIGGSSPNGRPPTPKNVSQTLHALLATVGARPPYVMVGHSWGGLLVRMFVDLFPGEVVGLVYIDPTDLRSAAEEETYYREQGYVGAAMLERKASLLRFPGADRGEFKEAVEVISGNFKEFSALRRLPDLPMAIFMSGAIDPRSWVDSPCVPRVCEDVLVEWRLKWLRDMMEGSTNATLTLATAARHHMHLDDPQLIISGIRRVLSISQPRAPQ